MAHIEFLAGLYMGPEGPVIPSHMIDATFINGAKKSKEGPIAKSSMFCDGNALLVYDGPKSADELWQDERFRFSAIVRVGTARVERMRPTFDKWSSIVTVQFDNEVVNIGRIDDWVSIAGTQVGFGDWRPKYGRFTAQRLPG